MFGQLKLMEIESSEIRCPVCKATQPPLGTCRRCKADLSLYLKALHSHSDAIDRLRDASDVRERRELQDYLRWLSPTTVDNA